MRFRFGDFALDTDRRELLRGAEIVRVAPQAFDLLEYLVRNRSRVVGKDDLIGSIWTGRTVSEAALHTRLNAARAAIGDTGKLQRFIKTIPRRGVRFVAAVREEGGQPLTSSSSHLAQIIQFCHSRDGTRIAYATCGEGPPIVLAARFMSHIEAEWDSPVWRPWIQLMARRHTLIRYDGRGCGLSDRDDVRFSLKKAVEDLASVLDATAARDFILFGISSGGPIAVSYAAQHSERIRRLVLFGTYTQGRIARSKTTSERLSAETRIRVAELGWAEENPAFRQLYTSLWIPEATAEQARAFSELIRKSTTPQNAGKLMKLAFSHDVRDPANRVSCPTTVLHARNDAVAPFEEGRMLAALISGARFVPLTSHNHLLLETEPAFAELEKEIEAL